MYAIPLISGLIGWITNKIAINLLFKPYKPTTFLKFQGVIPKNKNKIANKIGKIVNKKLINIEDILNQIQNEKQSKNLSSISNEILQKHIREKLPKFIPKKDKISKIILSLIKKQKNDFISNFSEIYKEKGRNDIEEIITKKIKEYDVKEIEKIIIEVANNELKYIERLGALLGFLIGLIQLFLIF